MAASLVRPLSLSLSFRRAAHTGTLSHSVSPRTRRSSRWAKVVGGGLGIAGFSTAAGLGAATHCDDVPKFSLDGDRYDQSTYWGRLQQIAEEVDVRTLLISDDTLVRSQALLADFQAQGALPDGATDADMWEAKRVVNAIIHKPTGEKMNPLGRMSGFIVVNVPICAGMLMHGPTSPMAALFWQFMNQSCEWDAWRHIRFLFLLCVLAGCGRRVFCLEKNVSRSDAPAAVSLAYLVVWTP